MGPIYATGNSQAASAPRLIPQVDVARNRMEEGLDRLAVLIETLNVCLTPVVEPMPLTDSAVDGGGTPSILVPLADRIDSDARRVECYCDQIASIVDRLGI